MDTAWAVLSKKEERKNSTEVNIGRGIVLVHALIIITIDESRSIDFSYSTKHSVAWLKCNAQNETAVVVLHDNAR